MATADEVVVLARLAGTRKFIVDAGEMSASMKEMGVAADTTGRAFSRTTRHGFLMSQALFTVRRIMFGTTLALLAGGVAVLRLGWSYNSAMQQANVALAGFFPNQVALNDELDRLFQIAKYTPFNFKDITLAFRSMYPPLSKLGISAATVNDTILAVTNGLSVAGRVTPTALNRVAVALQHMAFQGHLTGQTVNQLARDGLNISDVLSKELGITADQMHNIGKMGIPAVAVLKAINHYMLTEPGYKNAALKQSLLTFHGLVTTFTDSLSQIMGIVEKRVFLRLQNRLARLVTFIGHVSDQVKAKGGGLHALIASLNQDLTPGSNAVLKFWNNFAGALDNAWKILSGLIGAFAHSALVMGTLYLVLVSVNTVLSLLYRSMWIWLPLMAMIIPLWIAYKTTLWLAAIAQAVLTFEERLATTATKDLTFVQWLVVASIAAQTAATWLADAAMTAYIWSSTAAAAITEWLIVSMFALAISIEQMAIGAAIGAAATWLADAALTVYTVTTVAAAVATDWLTVSMWALLVAMEANPIVLIITAVVLLVGGLVILYFKWKAFHDAVNATVRFIWNNWPYIAPLIATAFGPIGLLIVMLLTVVKYFREIAQAATWAFDKMKNGFDWLAHHIPHLPHVGLPAIHFPGLASGGTVTSGGLSWVGERGPELMALPSGAQIYPHQQSIAPQAPWNRSAPRDPIIVQVMLDRKVLAQAVADEQAEAKARR